MAVGSLVQGNMLIRTKLSFIKQYLAFQFYLESHQRISDTIGLLLRNNFHYIDIIQFYKRYYCKVIKPQ